jgi:hypothetical protein
MNYPAGSASVPPTALGFVDEHALLAPSRTRATKRSENQVIHAVAQSVQADADKVRLFIKFRQTNGAEVYAVDLHFSVTDALTLDQVAVCLSFFLFCFFFNHN